MRGWLAVATALAVSGCLGGGQVPEPENPSGPGTRAGTEHPLDPALAELGRWLEPFDAEHPAVHLTLLGDGRLLYWEGLVTHDDLALPFVATFEKSESRVLDLSGPAPAVAVPTPSDGGASDLFCGGQALLPDGRVVAVGGTRWEPFPDSNGVYGTADVRVFEPASNTWEPAPPMAWRRWYPGVMPLSDGRVLVASGIQNLAEFDTLVRTLEVFDPATDTMTELPDGADNLLPMYPRLFVVPSGPLKGDVLYVTAACLWCSNGEHPLEATWSLAQSLDLGANAWTTHGPSVLGARNHAMAALLALRPPAYDARILVAGGTLQRSGLATPTTEIVDLTGERPAHRLAGPLHEGRWHANGVLLPDGTYLAIGGSRVDGVIGQGADKLQQAPVMVPELFDPEATDAATGAAGAWRAVAPMALPRVYHSTALLLPDARVISAGSVPFPDPDDAERHAQSAVEIYEPPYLFRGPRPIIEASPAGVAYGEPFEVRTPDATSVEHVVLLKPGTSTHVSNPSQRLVELEVVERAAGSLTVRAPPDGDVAPPGPWMLFLLNGSPEGPIPSVARFVDVRAA